MSKAWVLGWKGPLLGTSHSWTAHLEIGLFWLSQARGSMNGDNGVLWIGVCREVLRKERCFGTWSVPSLRPVLYQRDSWWPVRPVLYQRTVGNQWVQFCIRATASDQRVQFCVRTASDQGVPLLPGQSVTAVAVSVILLWPQSFSFWQKSATLFSQHHRLFPLWVCAQSWIQTDWGVHVSMLLLTVFFVGGVRWGNSYLFLRASSARQLLSTCAKNSDHVMLPIILN